MSVVIMATDEQFRAVLEFVDHSQLLEKLGPDATPTIYGGKAEPKPQAPDSLEYCIDLEKSAAKNCISNNDLTNAINFYDKLRL